MKLVLKETLTCLNCLWLLVLPSISLADARVSLGIAQGHLCAKVNVGNKWRWMSLDTAAPESSIKLAESTGQDGGKHVPLDVNIGELTLRRHLFKNQTVGPMGLNVPNTSTAIEGVLGFDLLGKVSLTVDFYSLKALCRIRSSDIGLVRDPKENERSLLLAKLLVKDGVPTLTAHTKLGAIRLILDLGSFTSFLSETEGRMLSKNVVLGGRWDVARYRGSANHKVVFLDNLGISNRTWYNLPFVQGDILDDFPSGLGWTVFLPFKTVTFDFISSEVRVAHRNINIRFLDHAMAIYGVQFEGNYLRLPNQFKLAAVDVKALAGVEPPRLGAKVRDQYWTPSGVGASKMLLLYEPWRTEIKYRYADSVVRGFLHPFWSSEWKR